MVLLCPYSYQVIITFISFIYFSINNFFAFNLSVSLSYKFSFNQSFLFVHSSLKLVNWFLFVLNFVIYAFLFWFLNWNRRWRFTTSLCLFSFPIISCCYGFIFYLILRNCLCSISAGFSFAKLNGGSTRLCWKWTPLCSKIFFVLLCSVFSMFFRVVLIIT